MVLTRILLAGLALLALAAPATFAQNCTGCAASTEGLQEKKVFDASGGHIVVLINSISGFCMPTLGTGGIDCIGSGCSVNAQYGAVGMTPGDDVFECNGLVDSQSRDDCKRPPGQVDSNGNYASDLMVYQLACSGNESYFSTSIPPLTAEVKVTCEECLE
mgnify:CR=1 FL=1